MHCVCSISFLNDTVYASRCTMNTNRSSAMTVQHRAYFWSFSLFLRPDSKYCGDFEQWGKRSRFYFWEKTHFFHKVLVEFAFTFFTHHMVTDGKGRWVQKSCQFLFQIWTWTFLHVGERNVIFDLSDLLTLKKRLCGFLKWGLSLSLSIESPVAQSLFSLFNTKMEVTVVQS